MEPVWGDGKIIGASANVVIVDIARKAGYPISFWQFFKCGFPVMVGSILMSTAYLWFLFPPLTDSFKQAQVSVRAGHTE